MCSSGTVTGTTGASGKITGTGTTGPLGGIGTAEPLGGGPGGRGCGVVVASGAGFGVGP